jgi:hypothetical protein
MALRIEDLKLDCRHFRGDVPCRPHKEHGVHCVDVNGSDCTYYDPTRSRILIVKLGAIGDVIRTTPLLHALKQTAPQAEIWWLTNSPEILPRTFVDVILPYTAQSLAILQATSFETIYCLDKDREACALSAQLSAPHKKGYTVRDGKCVPIDADAEHKYLTGVFDDISRANTKSYQREIFEICGFEFSGQEYIMPSPGSYVWKLPPKKKIVGLNTGCGGRWTSRLWPDEYWVSLSKKLKHAGYVPLLLGGEQEHAKNLKLARQSGATYLGHFPLNQFTSEVDQCHLVVTAVTMAMHLAIGLRKKLVLFNNIFNKHEFDLYGRGIILEPDPPCDCYYTPVCPHNSMAHISVNRVFDACREQLNAPALT